MELSRSLIRLLCACFAVNVTLHASDGHRLVDVWESSIAVQPRYLVGILYEEAGEAELLAYQLERWPELSVEAGGDFGQRARPGEERDQGMAARGEILARVQWSLLESGRIARQRALELRRESLRESTSAFDLSFRADVARAYILASSALERESLLKEAQKNFSEISKAAHQRLREGIEHGSAKEQIEKSESTWNKHWHEAQANAAAAQLKLGLMADNLQVQPKRIQLNEIPSDPIKPSPSPALAALRLEAKERRAQAEVISQSNRWRLDAIGQAGPYFSSAFDGNYEEEYFAGLRWSWSPDAAGVQRTRARAELRRANALTAEKAGMQRDWDQRIQELTAIFQSVPTQASDWNNTLVSAEASERISRLRWNEGVGSWQDRLEEGERLLSARLDELAWREQVALQFVEYAEKANLMHQLPTWIGQNTPTLK